MKAPLQAAGDTQLGRRLGIGPGWGRIRTKDGMDVTVPAPFKAGFSEDDGGAVFEVLHKGGSYRLDAGRFESYKEFHDEPPRRATVTPPSW